MQMDVNHMHRPLKHLVIVSDYVKYITDSVYCSYCLNGARCEALPTSAICHCAAGYFGDGCGQ